MESVVHPLSSPPPSSGGSGWKWSNLRSQGAAPIGRSSHSVCVVGHRVYVYGGEDVPRHAFDSRVHTFNLIDDCWELPIGKEEVGTPHPPQARLAHTMVAVGSTLWMVGGRNNEREDLNEVYSYDTTSHMWTLHTTTGAVLPIVSYHSSTAVGECVYVFGGCSGHDRLNELYQLDTRTLIWTQLPVAEGSSRPCPRGGPGLCAIGDTIYAYAGYSGKHELDDLWGYSLKTNTWERMLPQGPSSVIPPARSVHCVAAVGNYIVTFGGESSPSARGHEGAGQYLNDAWCFNITTLQWTRIQPPHRSPRSTTDLISSNTSISLSSGSGESDGISSASRASSGDETLHPVLEDGDYPPTARGWMVAAPLAATAEHQHTGIVIFGGFDGTDRLNDLHLLLCSGKQ
eukprot:TRINITY_DN3675_c0_g1_i1.p1 TRINITY_DN3675_c0_g1~~TRINITY_DN3675_c0_g1_i1.p1  ORF type:complete len:407 (+),score=53.82 TRINITY_DN3675_c0_g1_i1:23-1222(+)